jgi:hypothetical protein
MILHDEVNEKAVAENGSGLFQGTDRTAYIELYRHRSDFKEIQNDPNRGSMWEHLRGMHTCQRGLVAFSVSLRCVIELNGISSPKGFI